MKKTLNIFNFIHFLINHFSIYGQIRKDPELKAKSKKFAVRTIILSIIGAVSLPLCAFLIAKYGISLVSKYLFLGIALIIVLALIAIYLTLFCVVYGLMCVICQLTLNRRAISWIALTLYILQIVIIVAFAILLLT